MRKAAQAAVANVVAVAAGSGSAKQHPALEATAAFCRRELREHESAPHAVNLVRVVLPACPSSVAEPLLVELLHVMAKAQPVLLCSCLEAISDLFVSGAPCLSTGLFRLVLDLHACARATILLKGSVDYLLLVMNTFLLKGLKSRVGYSQMALSVRKLKAIFRSRIDIMFFWTLNDSACGQDNRCPLRASASCCRCGAARAVEFDGRHWLP